MANGPMPLTEWRIYTETRVEKAGIAFHHIRSIISAYLSFDRFLAPPHE